MIPAYGANLFNVEPVRESLHINYSDIRDRHSLEHLVREKDHIFDLAGQLSEATGWESKVDLSEGMRRTFDSYRQHESQYL